MLQELCWMQNAHPWCPVHEAAYQTTAHHIENTEIKYTSVQWVFAEGLFPFFPLSNVFKLPNLSIYEF